MGARLTNVQHGTGSNASMKVHVLSLGCPRTLVDSEGLAGILHSEGHTIAEGIAGADCVVVNTCAFIREAEEESIATILDLASLKRSGKLKRLYVAGCLPQKRRNEKEDLLSLLPEVDGFLGPGDLPKLPALIRRQTSERVQALGRGQAYGLRIRSGESGKVPGRPDPLGKVPGRPDPFIASPVPTLLFESSTPRYRLTPKHFAYLKISEGCDHACTFCSIPQFRGPHRSRAIEDLVQEAEQLASEGVVELNLIGQDTSYYGADRYGAPCLPELLRRLTRVKGIHWIRLLYAHPAHVTDGLIRAIRDCPAIVKYIDIPIQHISDDLLSAMRRETDGAFIRRMVERFRTEIPGIAIRTTFIVGFPGETEAHVEELAEFMRENRFERVGIFTFSPEPKTSAERMPGQIPEKVKEARRDALMGLQQEIAESINRQWLGREIEVLVDEPSSDGDAQAREATGFDSNDGRSGAVSRHAPAVRPTSADQPPAATQPGAADRPLAAPRPPAAERVYLGRTYADAPEVDGQVFLKSPRPLAPGEFVQAQVIDTYEYDLMAEEANLW